MRGLLAIARLGQTDSAAPIASDAVIDTALAGSPLAVRRRLSDEQEIIMADVPIRGRERALGAVVVEQDTDQILALQRDALDRIIGFAVLTIALVFLALLTFSLRLAWRIRGLGAKPPGPLTSRAGCAPSSCAGKPAPGMSSAWSRNVSQRSRASTSTTSFWKTCPAPCATRSTTP